jgi:uncharacterized protein
MTIIDAHCHAGKGDMLTAPWTTDAPLEKYFRRARAAGITKTIVVPAGHSDYATANAQLARIVARSASRLIGFAAVHAARDAGRIREMVKQAVTQWRFRGLKVHGHDAMPTREVCEAVQEYRIPMLLDVVGQAPIIDLLASQFRDVNFIIPHLGSFADDWRAQQQVVDQLARHPNVYADTAGVRRFDYLVQAVQRAGAHKLIFGSDGPWLHPGVELAKIRALGLSPADEQLVLSGNILRLMNQGRTQSEADQRRARAVRDTHATPHATQLSDELL